jgi:hypothetical protein
LERGKKISAPNRENMAESEGGLGGKENVADAISHHRYNLFSLSL